MAKRLVCCVEITPSHKRLQFTKFGGNSVLCVVGLLNFLLCFCRSKMITPIRGFRFGRFIKETRIMFFDKSFLTGLK